MVRNANRVWILAQQTTATTSNHISLIRAIYYSIIMTVHSKNFLANQWYQINKEWAVQLVGLRMRVEQSWCNGCIEEEKRDFYLQW